jgi:hypothetical protein
MRDVQHMEDYENGQWDAYNRVIDLIASKKESFLDTEEIYRAIIEMRPEPPMEYEPVFSRKVSLVAGGLLGFIAALLWWGVMT